MGLITPIDHDSGITPPSKTRLKIVVIYGQHDMKCKFYIFISDVIYTSRFIIIISYEYKTKRKKIKQLVIKN